MPRGGSLMLPKGSITKVYEYFFTSPKYENEAMRALQVFFSHPDLNKGGDLDMGNEQSSGFFNEWFLYDFIMSDGKKPIEVFIAENPLGLNNNEMKFYRDLLDNRFGIFEVLDIDIGRSINLRDLQTDKEWLVYENKATFSLTKGRIFFARVGKVGDHYELIGADSFSLQNIDEKTKKSFRKLKCKFTPKEANEILTSNLDLYLKNNSMAKIESKQEIMQRRREIEKELMEILEETGSNFELGDVLNAIYEEKETDDMTEIIAMFDRGGDISELENILELVNDAWNYFPHKTLGGLSPAEK